MGFVVESGPRYVYPPGIPEHEMIMAPVIFILLGCALLIVAIGDLIWSTLSTGGAGAVSKRVAAGLWRTSMAIHRRVGSHRFLEATGPLLVVTIVVVWIVLFWAGWLLIFTSMPEAVVDAKTQAPAALVDRVYFVGFTLFTLGMGDYVGGAPVWRVLTSVASINGLFAITLAITYLLPIVSAATAKRQLALLIDSLGDSTAEVVANGWNGEDFAGLENQLRNITPLLLLHSERHLAYPVLHYFHAAEQRAALAPHILVLDDAVTLLSECVPGAYRPDPSVLRATRHAIDVFLGRITHHFITQADEPPPHPDPRPIEAASVPLIEQAGVDEVFEGVRERRKWLQGFLDGDGWSDPPGR